MAVTARPRVREEGLAEAIGLGPDELAMRKRFLEFGDGDVRRLEGMQDLAQESVDAVIDAFYEHLLSFPETAAFFHDPEVLEFARHREKEYFIRLMQGDYEQEYVEDRLQLGTVHEKIGLPIRLFLGMYAFYLRQIAPRILDQHSGEPAEAFEAFHSLTKLLFFDIGLGVDTYIYQRERTIALQQEAIRELSTPVLRLRDRLLVLPIVGILDTTRAQQAHRSPPGEHPREPCEGRHPRRHRRPGGRLGRRESPPADGRRVAAHGRAGDRHRPLVERRAGAGDPRCRPHEAERRGRSPGRDRVRRPDHGIPESSPTATTCRRSSMPVPILKQGDCLIASVQAALSDADLLDLRDELSERVGRFRSKGVIIDVTVLDVLDSFASRTLRTVAEMVRLRGAETVIVGIQPDVAFAMVQLGLSLDGVTTVLDLEEGLAHLERSRRARAALSGG